MKYMLQTRITIPNIESPIYVIVGYFGPFLPVAEIAEAYPALHSSNALVLRV